VLSGVTWADGDFNSDGKVDDRDAAILAAHWGATSGGEEAVPEPSMLMLLVGLALGAWIVRWRRIANPANAPHSNSAAVDGSGTASR
jgi:hypothetical protein